jgi:hypothetical protein
MKDNKSAETDLPQPPKTQSSEIQSSETQSSNPNLPNHDPHRSNLPKHDLQEPIFSQSNRNPVFRTKLFQALRFLSESNSNLPPTKFKTLAWIAKGARHLGTPDWSRQ